MSEEKWQLPKKIGFASPQETAVFIWMGVCLEDKWCCDKMKREIREWIDWLASRPPAVEAWEGYAIKTPHGFACDDDAPILFLLSDDTEEMVSRNPDDYRAVKVRVEEVG